MPRALGLHGPCDHSSACGLRRAGPPINQGGKHSDGVSPSCKRPSVVALPSQHRYRAHSSLNSLGVKIIYFSHVPTSYKTLQIL